MTRPGKSACHAVSAQRITVAIRKALRAKGRRALLTSGGRNL